MAKPPRPNDSSDSERDPQQEQPEQDTPPFPDPPGIDHTPRMTQKGKTIFPRKLWGLLREGKITSSEMLALVFLLDQTDGWPVLHRMWVRLTNRDWAKALGMTKRGAVKVRDSLLEKGLIRRQKEGNTYVYQIRLPERDQEQKEARSAVRKIIGMDNYSENSK